MLDSYLRPHIDPILGKIAAFLWARNITPNMITFTGAMVAVYCFVALILKFYMLALIFLIVNRICDGLDGVLASHIDTKNAKSTDDQKIGTTPLGSFLDIVFDMLFYGGFVFFYAWGRPDVGDAAAFLLFAFMGTSASFLAHAILVEKHGTPKQSKHINKGFFYSIGLIEGSETIIFFALMCLIPSWFNAIAGVFGALCFVTTFARIRTTYNEYAPIATTDKEKSAPKKDAQKSKK